MTPISLLFLALVAGPVPLPQEPSPLSQERTPPRLIVLISVDQLIPEQLERLDGLFRGGYRRLLDEGNLHPNGMLGHAASETGPGHASLGTGVHPCRSGIVGNDWLAPDGTTTYCVGDPDASTLATTEGPWASASSPANLMTDGLADHLRAAVPEARSVGISFKDRSAILSTGRHPDWAFWWSISRAGFVSSSWYGEALPDWVAEFDEEWPFLLLDDDEVFDGERVTWRSSLPEDLSGTRTDSDDRSGEGPGLGGVTFPHVGPALDVPPTPEALDRLARWVYGTSYCDRLVIELGRRAVEALELGADEHPDYLFLGLSACDAVGHTFGPYSHEVTDVFLRDDLWLGELFEFLDERVGSEKWILALSSDHGVLPLPESLAEQGQDAGRLPWGTLQTALAGALKSVQDELGVDPVLANNGFSIRLDLERLREADLDPAEVRARLATAILESSDLIAGVFTREDIEGDGEAPLLEPIRLSYRPDRSPDLELLFPRGWLTYPTGTSHGTPYDYDRRVPLLFFGPGIPPGVTRDACMTVDVLPTLFSAAGLAVPEHLDGRPLH